MQLPSRPRPTTSERLAACNWQSCIMCTLKFAKSIISAWKSRQWKTLGKCKYRKTNYLCGGELKIFATVEVFEWQEWIKYGRAVRYPDKWAAICHWWLSGPGTKIFLGSPKETDSEEDFLRSPIDLFPFIRRQSGKIEEREIRSRSSNSHLSLFVICASSIVTLRI